jgi:Protein of unknown function (DUF2946)
MNKRVTAFTLCLLYFMFAVVAGTLPHNHSGGSLLAQKHCVACAVHINGVADVPVAVTVFSYSSAEFNTFHFDRLPLPSYLFLSTASRAPPHTSA